MPYESRVECNFAEVNGALAELRAEIKAAWKRIDEQRTLIDSVHDLALTTRDMAGQIKQLGTDQASIKHDIEELKDKPGKRWDTAVYALITGVVGFVLAWLSRGI